MSRPDSHYSVETYTEMTGDGGEHHYCEVYRGDDEDPCFTSTFYDERAAAHTAGVNWAREALKNARAEA
jgi:hypothetical protein